MAPPAKHICRGLETKLERDGAPALTAAEWHLLQVDLFLIAVESNTLPDILVKLSTSELLQVFDSV